MQKFQFPNAIIKSLKFFNFSYDFWDLAVSERMMDIFSIAKDELKIKFFFPNDEIWSITEGKMGISTVEYILTSIHCDNSHIFRLLEVFLFSICKISPNWQKWLDEKFTKKSILKTMSQANIALGHQYDAIFFTFSPVKTLASCRVDV